MKSHDTREEGLPPLREELTLFPGPLASDGSPTWTLQDPASNRFFRLGWQEFEIISRWGLASPERISASICAESLWQPETAEVLRLAERLRDSHLLTPRSAADRSRFLRFQQASHGRSWARLLHHYLALRIPLWCPEPFLRRSLPLVRGMFSGWFLLLMTLTACTGWVLILRQWERFTGTFLHFFNFQGMLYYATALLASKVLHELGHAYAAHLYGCRVARIGVVFFLLWPRLYTDTHDIWKLTSRRQRVVVGGAGMMAELILAALAALAWSFLDDGPLRSAAFVLASGVWVVTLAVNLNPLFRFDGYFLLSDILDLADLQQRAFQLGRWQLREWLFGWGVPPPERLQPAIRRFLLLFAFSAWCYRLALFLSVALLVYHQLFKVLGLLVLGVEVGWFLLRPVGQEVREWVVHRQRFAWNRQTVRTAWLLTGLLAGLLVPWDWSAVRAPALLQADTQSTTYAPSAAQVIQLPVSVGQEVEQGDLLLLLDDPELAYRLDTVERQILLLRWRLTMQTLENDPNEQEPVLQQALSTAHAERQSLWDEQKGLRVVAAFPGRVAEVARDLQVGDWVAKDEFLLTVIGHGAPLVKALVEARESDRIAVGARGLFYPAHSAAEPLAGRVLRMDPSPTRYLPAPYLASLHGGEVPVREQKDGRLAVEGAFYRVDLAVEQPFSLAQIQPGTLRIHAAPASLWSQWWRTALAVYRREGGF
ncbi:MAG: HlyD family efflux transporter periplasmic adaptor subunit [Magnetococcus sp. MYC-9]